MGDYVLTKEDVRDCKKFKDVIGKSTFKSGRPSCCNRNDTGFRGIETVAEKWRVL